MAIITRNFITLVEALKNNDRSVTLSQDNYIDYVQAFVDYFQQPLLIGEHSNWQPDLVFWNKNAQLQAKRMFSADEALKAHTKTIPSKLQ